MNKKLDIINLAAEFASEDLEVGVNAERDHGCVSFEQNWDEIAQLSYREGSIDLTIWDNREGLQDSWTNQRFEDTNDEWAQAKILFRQAVLDFLRGQEQNS